MNNKIMLTLDSVFDTRYVLLNKLANDISIEDYLKRSGDEFKYIAPIFKSLYQRRNKTLLRGAPLTPIMNLVSILEKELYVDMVNQDNVNDIYIDVNFYPYDLSDKDVSFLTKFFKNIYNGESIFRFVKEAPTVTLLKGYNSVIDYSGFETINNMLLSGDLLEGGLITTKLVVPSIISTEKVYKYVEEELFLDKLMAVFSIYVSLQFVDNAMFSAIYAKKKRE